MAPRSLKYSIYRLMLSALLIAFGMSGSAYAQVVTVANEADFLALVSEATREGFEGLPRNSNCTDGVSEIGTDHFDLETIPQFGGTSWLCVGNTSAGYPGPTEGVSAIIAGSNTGDAFNLEFSFDRQISAVYFELTDAVERGDAYFSTDTSGDYLVAAKGAGGLNTVRFGIINIDPTSKFTVKNTGSWDGWGVDNMIFVFAKESVFIDIKPGSDPNCFNSNGHGVIPVAILGSNTFDVTTIDQATLLFGGLEVRVRGNKGPLCSLEDSNLDGFLDMVCKFEDNADYWELGDGDATLTGNLYDGTEFEGTDSICVVP